jgi:hypothetical protein
MAGSEKERERQRKFLFKEMHMYARMKSGPLGIELQKQN